jgi:beta-galactosidase
MCKTPINLIVAVAALLACGLSAAAQSLNSPRTTASLDHGWIYWAGDAAGVEQGSFDDTKWTAVTLPHDWSITQPFDEQTLAGGAGGFLPTGVVWYRKHLSLPDGLRAKQVFVQFDGIMANSGVWINGHHLGLRPIGYVGLEYELTPFLHFGPGTSNVIAVRADTSKQPASRFYAGTGIYRHVRLLTTGAVHVAPWGTYVTTPKVAGNEATVRVQSEVGNDGNEISEVHLDVDLIGPDGKIAATFQSAAAHIAPGRTAVLIAECALDRPHLWNLDDPALYRADVRVVGADNKATDEDTATFGIRDARFEPETGFWLNGQHIKIKGVAVHEDGGAFGMAVPLAVWKQRLDALRALGANAIRTAHNPPAPELLDLADRMGFLVMDEFFDQWNVGKTPYDYHLFFSDWSQLDTRDIVRRDRNHPSIIIWSAGNEIHDTPYPLQAGAALKSIVSVVRKEDPSRPVTMALFRPNVTGDYHNGFADMLDVVGQNYRENELIAAHEQNRKRAIVGTENAKGRTNWLAVRDYAPYAGYFLWTGVDYMGETDRRGWPNVSNSSGLLDRTGQLKIEGMRIASWWSEKPVIHVVRNTEPPTDPAAPPPPPVPTEVGVATPPPPNTLFDDWTPANGRPHPETIEVYSNCEQVEAFLNGRSLGKRPLPSDASPRQWAVTFEPGEVRATCSNGGTVAGQDVLRTAGAPARIELSLDGSGPLGSAWDDLAFVRARIVDAHGVLVPNAANTIRFSASQPNLLVVTDNDDAADHTPFASAQRHAFAGRAIAAVRGTAGSASAITVTATARGLKAASIRIVVSHAR